MDQRNQSLSVEVGGPRLDAHLAESVSDLSRSQWKQLILDGHVLVNGRSCKPNSTLHAGDTISWTLPEPASTELKAEAIAFEILFEDEQILVLNKPPGLVVHPAVGNESGTLVNGLLHHDAAFFDVERAGIVHRLDKDTSGVMVVAKTDAVMAELQRQFKARETEKRYLAFVWGQPPSAGRIETQIGRHPAHRQKMTVLREGGRTAISNYQVLETFDEVALVQVDIETGRTHQIRVHLAHLGFPVAGDTLYSRARRHHLPVTPERQMLHASRLMFTHPGTMKRLSFEAPLFDDMAKLLKQLREGQRPD